MGLVELLIAMTVLIVALLALVAAMTSGTASIVRAGKVSTAASLADTQMQLYRALKYCSIRLDDASIPTSAPYTTDAAYNATQVRDTDLCSGSAPTCASGPPAECNASRSVTAADGKSYRVDSYIVHVQPSGARQYKQVTVVVRDGLDPTQAGLARLVSTFDAATG